MSTTRLLCSVEYRNCTHSLTTCNSIFTSALNPQYHTLPPNPAFEVSPWSFTQLCRPVKYTMSQHLNRKRPRDQAENEASDLESGASPAKSTRLSTAAAGSCSDPTRTPPGLPQDHQAHTCLVYIVEKKVSSGHLSHLRAVARKKGFPLTTTVRLISTIILYTTCTYMHPQYMYRSVHVTFGRFHQFKPFN